MGAAQEPACRLKLLLLHGFASSPAELRPLGQFLSCRGFEVVAPLLPGHGESPQAMRDCRLSDWTEAVSSSYWALRRDESPVGIIGHCLGGTLGLLQAADLNPRMIVCCATPVLKLKAGLFKASEELFSTESWFEQAHSGHAKSWRLRSSHREVPKEFCSLFAESIQAASKVLSEVRCPLLVAHSQDDSACPVANARHIIGHVNSQRRQLLLSKRAGHGLLVDSGRRKLFAEILNFAREQEQTTYSW